MKKLQEKLAKVQVSQLETRKEFTFYCCKPNCTNPCHEHHTCDNGGNGNGGGPIE